MLGFIKKDLLLIKYNCKILLALFIIYAIMTINGELNLYFIQPFLTITLVFSTFSYDNFNNWDIYALTLPNGRKNIVRSKYILMFLLIILISLIVTVFSYLVVYLNNKIDYSNIFPIMLITAFVSILIQDLIYPIIFKFGIEQARIMIFILVFAVSILGGIVFKYVSVDVIANILSFIYNYLGFIVLIFTYISYKISENIYLKKEF